MRMSGKDFEDWAEEFVKLQTDDEGKVPLHLVENMLLSVFRSKNKTFNRDRWNRILYKVTNEK